MGERGLRIESAFGPAAGAQGRVLEDESQQDEAEIAVDRLRVRGVLERQAADRVLEFRAAGEIAKEREICRQPCAVSEEMTDGHRGTVGAARAQNPDSGNSQFFIMFAPDPSLDQNYTVVGRVIAGMDAVDKIAVGEPPAAPTKIVKATIGG